MTNKDDKKLLDDLKQAFSTYTVPDIKHNIKAQYQKDIQSKMIPVEKQQTRKSGFLFPRFIGAFASLILIVVTVMFAFTQPSTMHATDDIRFQAITSVNLLVEETLLLNYHNDIESTITQLSYFPMSTDTLDEEIDELNKFVPLIEQALSKSRIATNSLSSDKSQFRYFERIQIVSSLNHNMSYHFYYNIVTNKKQTFDLDGVIYFQDLTFLVEAKHQLTNQNYETIVSISLDGNTITSQSEDSNQYVYMIQTQSQVASMRVSIDVPANRISINFTQGKLNGEYEFEAKENDANYISVLARNGQLNINIRAASSTEESEYEYEDVATGQTFRRRNPIKPVVPNRPTEDDDHPGNR